MSRPVKQNPAELWRPNTDVGPWKGTGKPIYRPDLYEVIDSSIDALRESFTALSLDINGESCNTGGESYWN